MIRLSSLGSINKGTTLFPPGPHCHKDFFPLVSQKEINMVHLSENKVCAPFPGLDRAMGMWVGQGRCISNGPFQGVNSLSLKRIRWLTVCIYGQKVTSFSIFLQYT